jgi:transcriptional regulator with XRE-family HTH domain
VAFGDRLRAARKHARLSQTSLAALTGFTRSYVTRVEAGTKPPSANFIERAIPVLGVKPSEIQELRLAAARCRRRILLDRHFSAPDVDLVNLFVECVPYLDARFMRAFLEAAHPRRRGLEEPAM